MYITRLKIKNWRNFQNADVQLQDRQFIVGPNAAGKSNLLDVFRFLRDVAKEEGGGLQKAIKDRGGVSKIRNVSAKKDPEISIEIEIAEDIKTEPTWIYSLGIKQESSGSRRAKVSYEKVYKGTDCIINRPDEGDEKDPSRLTQTYLEQIGANSEFREVVKFFKSITYLHLVPQLLRYADQIQGRIVENDPFGQSFLEKIAKTPDKTRKSRLRRIEKVLQVAVPQLKQLEFERDPNTGRPHLKALYEHWRKGAGFQREDQFSDGTLRLIGLMWALFEGEALLLIEEPELSLNSGIVAQIGPLVSRAQRAQKGKKRQIIISTHSEALLSDPGIDGKEVLMLTPYKDGTIAELATSNTELKILLQQGFRVSEVVLPKLRPKSIEQISLFDFT